MSAAAIRLARAGALAVGLLGVVLAINSMMGNNETGAGILLIASALGFGVVLASYSRL